MNAETLISELRELDAELHSNRVTDYYRRQDATSRERFVGLRAYVAQALADATYARLDVLDQALQVNDAALTEGIRDTKEALRRLNDGARALNILADVLTVLAQAVPGILDKVF